MEGMPDSADCPPVSFATAQVQAGYSTAAAPAAAVPPVYQSNAFVLPSLSHARDLFAHRVEGDVYARIGRTGLRAAPLHHADVLADVDRERYGVNPVEDLMLFLRDGDCV